MYDTRMRRRQDSVGSASEESSTSAGSAEVLGTEVVIRPRIPPPSDFRSYNQYQVQTPKAGDVDGEKFVEERMRQLGVLDTKRELERMLTQKLDANIEQDELLGALKRCRSSGGRRRPLLDRVTSVTDEITHVIRPSIVTSADGSRVYKVEILMGLFTSDVAHEVREREVHITGRMRTGPSLSKQITVEFPVTVDVTQLSLTYIGGVVRMTAPFRPPPQQQPASADIVTAPAHNGTPPPQDKEDTEQQQTAIETQRPPRELSESQRSRLLSETQRPLDESGFYDNDDSETPSDVQL